MSRSSTPPCSDDEDDLSFSSIDEDDYTNLLDEVLQETTTRLYYVSITDPTEPLYNQKQSVLPRMYIEALVPHVAPNQNEKNEDEEAKDIVDYLDMEKALSSLKLQISPENTPLELDKDESQENESEETTTTDEDTEDLFEAVACDPNDMPSLPRDEK